MKINAAARTPGYTQGQEQLALAQSTDGGKTFVKAVDNPLDVQLPDQVSPLPASSRPHALF